MAQYPTAAASNTQLYVAVNNTRTQLNGAINNSVTTITVDSTTGFPTAGLISIENEVIAYTGTNATQFTGCTRGFDGTTAASHVDGSFVSLRVVAAHHNNPKDEIIAVETDLVAAHGALNDAGTPAATATDIKSRLDHIVTEIKRITQNTNWYDTVAAGLKDIAGNTFIGVGRNRVINGEILIDQANAGSSVNVNSPTSAYGPDMFFGQGISSAGVFTLQQSSSTPPTGFSSFLRASCTTADASIAATDRYIIWHGFEGYNVRDFLLGTANAKTVTLSFWVRSSLTGTYTGALSNNAGNRAYPFEYTVNSADTWEYKTVTIALDTTGSWTATNGPGLWLNFNLAVGSNFQGTANTWNASSAFGTSNQVNFMSSNSSRTIDFTGVQLEIGSVATPYEYRSYGQELALCQRYYEKVTTSTSGFIGTVNNAGTATDALMYYIAEKRVTPTITFSSVTVTFSNQVGTVSVSPTTTSIRTRALWLGFSHTAKVTGTAVIMDGGTVVVDARL